MPSRIILKNLPCTFQHISTIIALIPAPNIHWRKAVWLVASGTRQAAGVFASGSTQSTGGLGKANPVDQIFFSLMIKVHGSRMCSVYKKSRSKHLNSLSQISVIKCAEIIDSCLNSATGTFFNRLCGINNALI